MKKCRLEKCQRPARSLGLCGKHHEWQRRHPGQEVVYKEQRTHEKHRMTGSREWMSWVQMNQRCYNKNCSVYQYYGGRGITVCDEWRNSLLAFYRDLGPRPAGMSLDRIDVNEGYNPKNCRWATAQTQARNRRMNKNNKSGVVGVSWDKLGKRWNVDLSVNGKKVYRKGFKVMEDAIEARKDAEKKYIISVP